ncbi:MAG TPA: L-serine ammonia-lyase, iron-sulfur-dependent, subunit alpha [Chroococcales cyanobacterium]
MNLYKEVVKHEVFPAMGCTEPIALALGGAIAAEGLDEPLESILFSVNIGTYKNGLAVTIPNTDGEKGNLIAGVLGALIAKPERKMEILKEVSPSLLAQAKKILKEKKVSIGVDPDQTDLYLEVKLNTKNHRSCCIVSGSHTNLIYKEVDKRILLDRRAESSASRRPAYKEPLSRMTVSELVDLAEAIDEDDILFLKRGVEMNLAISQEGMKLKKVGYYLLDLIEKGYLLDDVFASTKIMTACAADARMDGVALPVMSSGGSGNQGIVASLVPYNVGKSFKIEERTIYKSIALSHLLNAYVKVFTGELACICGCAIAAGVGATADIVYQQKGKDLCSIPYAINNLVSDIGGMICDGAKSGCAFKVISSTDAAIRAAYLGIHRHGITRVEGFVGRTVEETIKNLGHIAEIGMAKVDDTIVGIMLGRK